MELVFRIVKWVTTLDTKKLLILALLAILGLLGYMLYESKQDTIVLARKVDTTERKKDSIIAVLTKEVQECGNQRMQDLQKSNAHWAQKFEELQERLYEDYKTIDKIKRRK